MEIKFQEVVSKRKSRSEFGRVVVTPPKVKGSVKQREENQFFMCCNRAFLTEERYKQHRIEVKEHGKPIDFSKLPRPPAPLQPERKAIYGPSSREFWIQRKKGVVDKVFQVNDHNSELDINVQDTERLERVTVMDVDSSRNGHRGGRYTRCAICNLSTDNKTRHMKICHANGPYKCQYCPCTFIVDKSRSLHQRRMHRIQALPVVSRKKNVIARAKKQLVSTKLAREMELQWKNNRVSQCPICKKTFSSIHTAREHLNSHYGIKPHKCDQCSMAFIYSSGLRRHKRTIHSFVPRYFCSNCKAGFPSSQSLRYHFKSVHLNKSDFELKGNISTKQSKDAPSEDNEVIDDNPLPTLELQCPAPNASGMYDCHVCSKQLTTTQTWRGHMRIHQNVKPYKCKLCGTSFRLNSTRHCHIKNCHTNGPYKCPHVQCTCSFDFPRARQRHLRSCRYSPRAKNGISNHNMKGNTLSSGLIKDKLKADFNNHSNAKRSTCSLCLKEFASVHNIAMHKQRAHGSGPYKCTFCCCRYYATQALFTHLTLEHGMEREEWDFNKKCIFPGASRRIQLTYSDMKNNQLSTTDELSTGATDNQNTKEVAEVATPNLVPSIGKRMIECNLCHLKVTFNSLQTHKRTSHFHTGKYKCPDCPCKFMVTKGLFVHRAKYHGLIGKNKARQTMAESESNLKHGNAFLSTIIPPPKIICAETPDMEPSDALSYMCSFCEDTFQDKASFREHIKVHQAETAKKFECDICHVRFAHRSSVFHHKRKSHLHSGTFQCSKCSCKFMSAGGLTNHTKVHHALIRNKSNKFLARSRIMGTGSVLKKTIIMKQRNMNSANLFQCSICAKLLSSQYSLDLHREIHTRKGKRKYQCDLCHLKFLHPGSIVHHKKRCHNHNGKYKCSKCSCKFLAMGGLINHETKFHGWIGRQKRRQLEQSTDKHTGRTVECKICFLQIHAATKMQQHQQNCHFHDGTFQCSFCTCKFKTFNGLSRHKMKYHGVLSSKLEKKNVAAVNSTSSVINRLLSSAINTKISTFTKAQKVLKKTKQQRGASGTICGNCGCNFSRKSVLMKHMMVAHSNGAYKCKYCNCCFHHATGLARHVKWHETGHATGRGKSNENTSEEFSEDAVVPAERIKNVKNHATGRFNLNFLKIRGSSNLGKKRALSNIANISAPSKTAESLQEEQSSTGRVPLSPPKLPRSPVKYKFRCDNCGIRFSTKLYLENHSKRAHVVGGMSCNDCPCTFANALSLAAHKRVYHNLMLKGGFKVRRQKSSQLPQTPAENTKSANSPISYVHHKWNGVAADDSEVTLESNTVETNNDKITPVNSLIRTTKINNMPTPSFSEPQSKLQFKCNWCAKSFATKRVLSRHILCHTRPESCPQCNLRFRIKEEVLKHIKTHHGNGKYQCSSCSCSFSSAVGRNIHIGAVHKKQTSCSPINHSFTNDDFVIEHELQEEYDDNEPFIQVNSTYSQDADYVEFGEESEPIIQGILDGNYSSNFVNSEVGYGREDKDKGELEEEEGANTSSSSVSQDNMTVEEHEPIIQHVACKENISGPNYQTSSGLSSLVQKDSIPKKAKAFSPKSRPIKCGTCGITCYGPETLRLHMESHKEQTVDQISSTSNSVEGSNGNERRDLKCESCGNEFHNTDELAKHSRTEHDETGHYRCAYCPCTMKTETNLRYHFMKYHDICLLVK